MKVKKLPKDTGTTGWNAVLPERKNVQSLEHSINADWVVIGGGFAGLAAVRRLSQLHPQDRIVLLEASRIGEGPAGRSSGFMIDLPHDLASADYGGGVEADRVEKTGNRAAIGFASDLATEFGLSKETFSISGKINGAATKKGVRHNQNYAAHLNEIGEECEMLTRQQMQKLTGTDYYLGGLSTPGTAIIQPAKFVREVASNLKSSRISIFEDSPVVELEQRGDWIATTPKGQVTAPKVILAVNGHTNSFGFYKHRLMHVFTYASMTRELSVSEVKALGGEAVWGLTPADPLGTTVRRMSGTGGHRILIRNRFTYDPSMEISAKRIARVGTDHDRSFKARFPMLKNVGMEHRWGGRLCLSWNSVPAFGEVEQGLFMACCQNGLGISKGTLGGMLAADLASNVSSPALDAQLNYEAPRKLPFEPFARIGERMKIRVGELAARQEL